MINHARTLLLNRPGEYTPVDSSLVGDEYIPLYKPKVIPGGLARVTSLLYSPGWNYQSCLQRTAQFIGILHSTEFEEYVYALDSRVTYKTEFDFSKFKTLPSLEPDLGTVLASLKAYQTSLFNDVFGAELQQEPFATFHNLFVQEDSLPLSMSGVLLAYIYTVDKL